MNGSTPPDQGAAASQQIEAAAAEVRRLESSLMAARSQAMHDARQASLLARRVASYEFRLQLRSVQQKYELWPVAIMIVPAFAVGGLLLVLGIAFELGLLSCVVAMLLGVPLTAYACFHLLCSPPTDEIQRQLPRLRADLTAAHDVSRDSTARLNSIQRPYSEAKQALERLEAERAQEKLRQLREQRADEKQKQAAQQKAVQEQKKAAQQKVRLEQQEAAHRKPEQGPKHPAPQQGAVPQQNPQPLGDCPGPATHGSPIIAQERERRSKSSVIWLRTLTIGFLGILCLVVAWYFISPHWTFYRFERAVRSGDVEAIDDLVDFQAVREDLKAQARADILKRLVASSDDNPLAPLGLAFGNALLDNLIDSIVSPSGIAALIQGKKPTLDALENTQVPATSSSDTRNHHLQYVSLSQFKVVFDDYEKNSDSIALHAFHFNRTGFSWRLARIRVVTPGETEPPGKLPAETGATPAESESPPEPTWAAPDEAVRQGDLQVQIADTAIGKVRLEGSTDRDFLSSDEYLVIKVGLINKNPAKKVDYYSWSGRGMSFHRDYATLKDNFGNNYRRIGFGSSTRPVGSVDGFESIYPNKLVTDVLAFELPLDTATHLDLELPAQNYGGEGMIRFRIPITSKFREVPRERATTSKEVGWRVWTLRDGTYTTEAKFLRFEFEGSKVRLQKRDGEVIVVSMNNLKDQDQNYIRNELTRRRLSR